MMLKHGIRRRSSELRAGIGAAAMLLAGGAYAVACSSDATGTSSSAGTSSSSSSGGGGSPQPITSFSPQGCAFTVAPRMEYQQYTASFPTVGATPNIRRVRLGLGGNVTGSTGRVDPATTIAFAWQTDEGTDASEVAWGTDPDPAKWPAANRASGVTWITPKGALNPTTDERMHEVYVCGLDAETTYYYRVGGGPAGSEVWSDVLTFTTMPKPGPTKVTIAVTGDSRGEQSNAWQILQRRIHALGPTMQLFSGDMINLATDQGEWEKWLDRAYKNTDNTYLTLGQIVTLSAHGNHESHTTLFFGNLVLPQDNVAYPHYGELFYSVDVGPVHIVVLDDAWVVDPTGDTNYAGVLQSWLDSDLTAAVANQANVPWIITMHHHGEYSSSVHGQDPDVLRGRQFFTPIWKKYHVDLALAGHDHDYERSKPLDVGTDPNNPTPTDETQGTVYVVCAGSGADPYPASTSAFTAISKDFQATGAIGGYGILTADAHNLTLNAYELHADASDPVIDTYTITK